MIEGKSLPSRDENEIDLKTRPSISGVGLITGRPNPGPWSNLLVYVQCRSSAPPYYRTNYVDLSPD